MRGRRLLSPRGLVRRFSPAVAAPAAGAFMRLDLPGRAPWRAARNLAPLGRIGSLEVKLAGSAAEVRRAQMLRYHVFYEEMSAIADLNRRQMRRDTDRFDLICDHLLVLDHANLKRPLIRLKPEVVGTYRLLRQEVAEAHGEFYTAGEYDIGPLIDRNPHLRFLELGRSCVLKGYRDKRTLELLWHGIWTYVLLHRVDVMIGCASLEGTDPDGLALPLSFLHHHARAPEVWRVSARSSLHVEMNRMPRAAVDAKAALRALPPLIKGYLRLGAYVGDGAVVDYQFGTTDVLIVLPVAGINSRYVDYYGADASRYAIAPINPRERALADA
jgi:putative hemolysin